MSVPTYADYVALRAQLYAGEPNIEIGLLERERWDEMSEFHEGWMNTMQYLLEERLPEMKAEAAAVEAQRNELPGSGAW